MRPNDPKRIRKDVGRKVAELRRKRNLTQAGMAEAAGVSTPYLARLEGGQENLTLDSLCKVANVLDVRAAELMKPPRSRAVRRGRPRAE
jgi:transcriptional regulator with XRE-family HTH domain